jgi:hypothetical protein
MQSLDVNARGSWSHIGLVQEAGNNNENILEVRLQEKADEELLPD